jgi:hypothetical protein
VKALPRFIKLAKARNLRIIFDAKPMNAKRDNLTAKTAQPLPMEERREAARKILDKAGKPHLMRTLDFREPTQAEREFAKTLEPMAERCLSRGKRKVA